MKTRNSSASHRRLLGNRMGANEMVTYLEALQKQVAEVKKAIWKLPFSTRALSEIDATLDVHAQTAFETLKKATDASK